MHFLRKIRRRLLRARAAKVHRSAYPLARRADRLFADFVSNRRRIPDAAFFRRVRYFLRALERGLYFVDESAFRNFKFNVSLVVSTHSF